MVGQIVASQLIYTGCVGTPASSVMRNSQKVIWILGWG